MADTIPTAFTVPLVEYTRLANERDTLRAQLSAAQAERDAAVRLMRQAQDEDSDCWQMGFTWHEEVKALLAAIDAAAGKP